MAAVTHQGLHAGRGQAGDVTPSERGPRPAGPEGGLQKEPALLTDTSLWTSGTRAAGETSVVSSPESPWVSGEEETQGEGLSPLSPRPRQNSLRLPEQNQVRKTLCLSTAAVS